MLRKMKNHKKSLALLDKFLSETPEAELKEILSRIDNLEIDGPTIPEYFNSIETTLAFNEPEYIGGKVEDFLDVDVMADTFHETEIVAVIKLLDQSAFTHAMNLNHSSDSNNQLLIAA